MRIPPRTSTRLTAGTPEYHVLIASVIAALGSGGFSGALRAALYGTVIHARLASAYAHAWQDDGNRQLDARREHE